MNYVLRLGEAFGIAVVDQLIKAHVSGLLPLCTWNRCESIELLPFFKLTLLHNTGAAFSFLAGGSWRWFLVGLSAVVSVVLIEWLRRIHEEQALLAFAVTLILGGALGNLYDRVMLGYVVDFVVLHYDAYYFPAFNLADAAISVGAALLILDMIVNRERT